MTLLTARKSLLLSAALLAAGVLTGVAAPSAHAQANVTFTGGNGAPLVVSLLNPITYTITQASTSGGAPLFIFDGSDVGSRFLLESLAGTITYSINGGALNTINTIGGGFYQNGSITSDDAYLFGTFSNLNAGDTVVLTAGTLTTTSAFAGPPLPSGSYTTFITDAFGTLLSRNGTSAPAVSAVPEPSEYAAMGMAGLSLCGLMVRARRKKAAQAA